MPRLISMTDHLSFKTVLMLLVGARHDKPGGARHMLIVWRMHSMTIEKLVIRGYIPYTDYILVSSYFDPKALEEDVRPFTERNIA